MWSGLEKGRWFALVAAASHRWRISVRHGRQLAVPFLSASAKQRNEVGEAIKINVRGMGGTVVRAEAIVHCGCQRSRVARGLDVNFGIADQDGFGGSGAELAKDHLSAERIRFFRFKAVAAVHRAKIFCEAEPSQDADADAHWFVREDR